MFAWDMYILRHDELEKSLFLKIAWAHHKTWLKQLGVTYGRNWGNKRQTKCDVHAKSK